MGLYCPQDMAVTIFLPWWKETWQQGWGEAEGMGGLVWPSCSRAQRAQHCTLELGEAAFSSVASAC